jgi:DNA-binding Lrp family transcriptional regulator
VVASTPLSVEEKPLELAVAPSPPDVADALDRRLIALIQDGLPLKPRPYAEIAGALGVGEQTVIDKLQDFLRTGVIKRLGVVVRHHELGYTENAMVVWDVADGEVDEIGERLGKVSCVTLCYRRARRPPRWPYNLYCMIHGRDRQHVNTCIDELRLDLGLKERPHAVLFSARRFRQRGARYAPCAAATAAATGGDGDG